MKVTEVKTFFVHAVRQNWLFVKVTTDTGLTGCKKTIGVI